MQADVVYGGDFNGRKVINRDSQLVVSFLGALSFGYSSGF